MTILVTGGGGYIGSHMVHALADAGEPVVVIDNLSTGFRQALPAAVPLHVADIGDGTAVAEIIRAHGVTSIIHFAASVVVPDSVRDPLGYYRNNTANARTLLEAAVTNGVPHFIFSSTAAVYGNPLQIPVSEDAPANPMSPYGSSKLMVEQMLRDVAVAHPLRYVALRYFNVAGADPDGRTGQSTVGATHLIKVAVETAVGRRPYIEVYGCDYPTPDGTCVRDYIHVTDLVSAHMAALEHLRAGGGSNTFNCGYGHGYSVLEVIEAVKRAAGHDFPVRQGRQAGRAIRRRSWRTRRASARRSAGSRALTISIPSCVTRLPGSAGCWTPNLARARPAPADARQLARRRFPKRYRRVVGVTTGCEPAKAATGSPSAFAIRSKPMGPLAFFPPRGSPRVSFGLKNRARAGKGLAGREGARDGRSSTGRGTHECRSGSHCATIRRARLP